MVGFLFSFVLSFFPPLVSWLFPFPSLLHWPAWASSSCHPSRKVPAPSCLPAACIQGQNSGLQTGLVLPPLQGMGVGEGAFRKKKVKSLVASTHSDPGRQKGFVDLDSLGMSSCQPGQDLGLPRAEALPATRIPPLWGLCVQRSGPETS